MEILIQACTYLRFITHDEIWKAGNGREETRQKTRHDHNDIRIQSSNQNTGQGKRTANTAIKFWKGVLQRQFLQQKYLVP